MDASKSSCDSTTLSSEGIPRTVMWHVNAFKDIEFESHFSLIFKTNPLNPNCKLCYLNFTKLLYCLLREHDIRYDVDTRFACTKAFMDNCFRDFVYILTNCPNRATTFHTETVLSCTTCMQKCIFLLECTARSFFGMAWRPLTSFGMGSCHLFTVFIQQLLKCRNGCFVDEDEVELLNSL